MSPIANLLRTLRDALRRRKQARVTYEALRGLDDRTLRDLGFHRSELSSVAVEFTGVTARRRALLDVRNCLDSGV